LITGVAGFIGSNLLEFLLQCDKEVVGLDNFSTGHRRNLDDVRKSVGEVRWSHFNFLANIWAATTTHTQALNTVFNIGTGEQTALRDLYFMIRDRHYTVSKGLDEAIPWYVSTLDSNGLAHE
jgi:nucleoside-diphosphate-sugar epimerase